MDIRFWLCFLNVVAQLIVGFSLPCMHTTIVAAKPRFRFCTGSVAAVGVSAIGGDNAMILKKIDRWACVKNCGACCKLGPLDSRPDLESYLTPAELSKYRSMVGADDWCVHFDQATRYEISTISLVSLKPDVNDHFTFCSMCTVYDERPDFCRVEPRKFKTMYGIEEDELNVGCFSEMYA